MKLSDEIRCSFCDRPRRLAMHMIMGNKGQNICDLCVLDAGSRSEATNESADDSRCSFCGRPSSVVSISLMNDKAAICTDCVENSSGVIDDLMGPAAEFLNEEPSIDKKKVLQELIDLSGDFAANFEKLYKSFEEESIDWTSYNILAQILPSIKSKAGLMGLGKISEEIWEIESTFKKIHFEDVEKNRPSIEKLAKDIEKLLEGVKSSDD